AAETVNGADKVAAAVPPAAPEVNIPTGLSQEVRIPAVDAPKIPASEPVTADAVPSGVKAAPAAPAAPVDGGVRAAEAAPAPALDAPPAGLMARLSASLNS